jgi:hypothetical protein
MDVRLHQRQVSSPLIPPARGNGRDVAGVAQCPALEVLTANEWRAGAHSLQHKEAPEQPHRWPYPYIHLTEVDKDDHQSDGVRRKMLQLEPVVLQQCEEEGGQRRHQSHQGVRCEEDKVPRPHVGQRCGPALHLPRETKRLPPH